MLRSIMVVLCVVTNRFITTLIINYMNMKRILIVAMTILLIAVQSLSAQKVGDNQNDRYYKAREILENGGDRNKAAELLTENIDEYPQHIPSYLLMVGMERNAENYGEALRLIDRAMKNNHKKSGIDNAQLLWWKASIYADMDEDEKGIAVMQQAVKMVAKSDESRLMDMLQLLAQLHYNLKQYDESDKVYSRMRKIDETEQLPMIGLARNMIARENYDEALAILEDCKKYDEDYPEIYRFEMAAYEGMEQYRKMIDAMIKLYENSDDTDYLSTDRFMKDPKYSIALLKEKIAGVSDNGLWKLVLASVYTESYNHSKAIPLLTDLINEYGNDPDILQERAECYEDMGLLDLALNDISHAIDGSKGDDIAYNHASRARILRAAGRYEEAVEDIEVYIERFPTRAYGYSMRGSSKEQMGDYNGAMEDYNEGISLDEDYSYLYLRRGKLYSELDKMDHANADFETLCQKDTALYSGSSRHFGLLFQMKYDEAFEWIDKKIEENPYDPVHIYDKACMYSLIGSLDDALKYLEESLAKGYRKLVHIENDSDMDLLRSEREDEYDAIMAKYYLLLENERKAFLKSDGDTLSTTLTEVALVKKYGGTYEIPCTVNGLPLKMIFDTGASDVTVSSVEASFMLKNGYLDENDIKGTSHYMTASGDIHEGTILKLKEVRLGDAVLKNIEASVVHNQKAPLLLGQSVLERFGTITIDNVNSKLLIKQ